jgi:PKD repeat protein
LGDGNVGEFTADTASLSLNYPYAYSDPGDYTAKLTVRDNAGFEAISQVTVHVTTPPPTITFTASPLSGSVPLTVTFSFTAGAGAGAKITKWTLLFGDRDFTGQEGLNVDSLTKTVTHDYTQTGSYTATLRVWDTLDQMSEDTVDIEVTAGP